MAALRTLVKPGETVIIAPATGSFGTAAVKVALAMGARVIAMGRNQEILDTLSADNARVESVQIAGDVEADIKSLQSFGPIHAYFDISPREASNSTHFKSCMLALGQSGRMSFMGSLNGDLVIPLSVFVRRDLQLKGKWMYTRKNILDLIRMIEVGLLKLGGQKVDRFGLEDWETAFDAAAEYSGRDKAAIIVP